VTIILLDPEPSVLLTRRFLSRLLHPDQRRARLLTALLTAFLLAGHLAACQTFDTATPTPQRDLVAERIAASSERIARHLDRLNRIEAAHAPQMPPPVVPSRIPPALRQPITLKGYTGPLHAAARSLADHVAWTVVETGHRPSTPILVTIDADAEPWFDVVQSIGTQAGARATVQIDPNRRVIAIAYPTADQ
jgi:defect-in-organelle-trafficking protein DotD